MEYPHYNQLNRLAPAPPAAQIERLMRENALRARRSEQRERVAADQPDAQLCHQASGGRDGDGRMTEPTTPPLAPIRDYESLRKAINARWTALGITMLDLDAVTGFHDGYSAKLLRGVRHFGDMSLPVMLQALGVELVLRPCGE